MKKTVREWSRLTDVIDTASEKVDDTEPYFELATYIEDELATYIGDETYGFPYDTEIELDLTDDQVALIKEVTSWQ